MVSTSVWIAIAVIAVLVVAALVFGLVRYRRRRISLASPTAVDRDTTKPIDRSGGYTASSGITFSQSAPPAAPPETPERIDTDGLPAVGDDATIPRDAPKRPIADVQLPEVATEAPPEVATEAPPEVATEAPPEVRPRRHRKSRPRPHRKWRPRRHRKSRPRRHPPWTPSRLRKAGWSGCAAGSPSPRTRWAAACSGCSAAGDLDEDSWEEVEDTLLIADLGPVVTDSVVTALRSAMASSRVRTEAEARAVLREVLIAELRPELDRSIKALPHDDKPSVLLVVGVNGTGKTTTVGKLARVLVADGRRVVLGAADTFRAAAADQLQTWASRVGAQVVRGAEGADPASVAFDAVDEGIEAGADVVVIDTAGRLHTKTGLMDELGKVKRVVSRRAAVDEVLLVLDATIGQNGLTQARVFADVVDITGVVLTKLDGTAKGGIVFRVQQELGVPVKLVGLGEGPDDLAPFEPAAFVDALLG